MRVAPLPPGMEGEQEGGMAWAGELPWAVDDLFSHLAAVGELSLGLGNPVTSPMPLRK